MRRWTTAALVVAALGGAAAAPSATAVTAAPGVSRDAALLHTAQYYGERHYGGDWGPRHRWREHRRARDEARIARRRGGRRTASSRSARTAAPRGTRDAITTATTAATERAPSCIRSARRAAPGTKREQARTPGPPDARRSP